MDDTEPELLPVLPPNMYGKPFTLGSAVYMATPWAFGRNMVWLRVVTYEPDYMYLTGSRVFVPKNVWVGIGHIQRGSYVSLIRTDDPTERFLVHFLNCNTYAIIGSKTGVD